jgi:NAD(P)-dependent dehydrogenase (short-subunit alcohol dehydrogenase family)
MAFHPDSLPDLVEKVYIVTGGTSGVFASHLSSIITRHLQIYRGYYTAARLAQHGAHVYLCARSASKGSQAIASIKTLYPRSNITPLEMDHTNLSSVVSAAKRFISKENVLHGLINNAGIMATPFEITEDGHEGQWQTNYLAHWIFTSFLLPLMLSSSKSLPPGSVRIVNVSSIGHTFAPTGGINFADTSLPDKAPLTRYGQSKLANILHAKTLNKLYGPSSPSSKAGNGEIWTSSVHPGLVKSGLGSKTESSWWKVSGVIWKVLGISQDGDTGCRTSVFCAASLDMKAEQSGRYFVQIAKLGSETATAKDMDLAAKLEDWTKAAMKKENGLTEWVVDWE